MIQNVPLSYSLNQTMKLEQFSTLTLPLHVIWEVNPKHIPNKCYMLCSWDYFNPSSKHRMELNPSQTAFHATIHVPEGEHKILFEVDGKRCINKDMETVVLANKSAYNVVFNDGKTVHLQSAATVKSLVLELDKQSSASTSRMPMYVSGTLQTQTRTLNKKKRQIPSNSLYANTTRIGSRNKKYRKRIKTSTSSNSQAPQVAQRKPFSSYRERVMHLEKELKSYTSYVRKLELSKNDLKVELHTIRLENEALKMKNRTLTEELDVTTEKLNLIEQSSISRSSTLAIASTVSA